MKMCLSHISARELYGSYGRLLPELLELPRTAKLDVRGAPAPAMLRDDLRRVGVHGEPCHLLVRAGGDVHPRPDIVFHERSTPLPPRSLIKISDEMAVVSPELMFLQVASTGRYDLIDLVELGFELCGTYVIDESWDGYTPTGDVSITNRARIERLLERERGARGAELARRAVSLVLDGSHSPMETVLAMLTTLPRRLGGLGLPGARMNMHVVTALTDRFVDVAFPDRRCGLEYQGVKAHPDQRRRHDDRRRNELAGSGMVVLSVWHEDLADPVLFRRLVDDLARTMGMRLRIRDPRFPARQNLLRMRLVPALRRFEGIGG